MKIYRIYQDVNDNYDTYDSAIVCAENEEEAKKIHPAELEDFEKGSVVWCDVEDVKVEYIGEADPKIKKGVILASYNAG